MATKAQRAAAAKARRDAKAAAADAAADTKTRTSPSPTAAPEPATPEIVNSPRKKRATSPARNDGPAERAARVARALAKEAEGGTVKVRATAPGMYIGRRKEGDEFPFPVARLQKEGKDGKLVAPDAEGATKRVLPSWMELVEE